jgi:hypothetical protein
VVPPAAVLVDGHDHVHVLPLRARAQRLDRMHDVAAAGGDVGITRMHVQIALLLVERDDGQTPRARVGEEAVRALVVAEAAVAQTFRAGLGARPEIVEVVEWLMVILEAQDHGRAVREIRAVTIERLLEGARIPRPFDAAPVELVADVLVGLRRPGHRVRIEPEIDDAVRAGRERRRCVRRHHCVDCQSSKQLVPMPGKCHFPGPMGENRIPQHQPEVNAALNSSTVMAEILVQNICV